MQASAALALACKAHIKNPQTLKNVLMLLSVSQVMLLRTSPCAAARFLREKTVQSRLGVGWEEVWLAHLCRLAGRRTEEECTHTQVQGGGSESAACRLDVWRCLCLCFFGFQWLVVYFNFPILLFISKQTAVLDLRRPGNRWFKHQVEKTLKLWWAWV